MADRHIRGGLEDQSYNESMHPFLRNILLECLSDKAECVSGTGLRRHMSEDFTPSFLVDKAECHDRAQWS